MAEAELKMERPLAMRLLHEAQIADTEVAGVVTARDTADRFYVGDPDTALRMAENEGRTPWAVFAFRPGHFEAPGEDEFRQQPALLRITACLETKGVLQLRVFRSEAGCIVECPLKIVD